MAKVKHPIMASALIAAVVLALLVTMAESGLAAPGDTTRVSVSGSGEEGNLESGTSLFPRPSISADGRYVAFISQASNLVPNDTNGRWDIFVRDLEAGTTELVSVDDFGNQQDIQLPDPPPDDWDPDFDTFCGLDISDDGRYVAFGSYADNLVAGDTNAGCDVFVRDLESGTTERVSVNSTGIQANDESYEPSLSADGRYVAFTSDATNLVANDTNATGDVFVRDLQARTTDRISLDSSAPSISDDGRYVAFHSEADNLVAGDTNGFLDVFVRDLQAGTTERISVDSSAQQANDESYEPSLSADGRYVAFYSYADNLVAGDTNSSDDIFVRDLQAGTTELVSVDSFEQMANNASYRPSISDDGRYVAFESYADNLVAGDTNGVADVFVRDVQTGTTELVSVDSFGEEGNHFSDFPSISDDGRYVAFTSSASNLVAGDTNGVADIFVRERGSKECTVTGTEASDALEGTEGSDIICGLGGNDTMKGLGANDVLKGGSGNDTLIGGEGDDTLNGGMGLDTASFESSHTDIVASLVTNTATGEGTDTLQEMENLRGSSFYDELTGSPGTNKLWGSGSTDRIFGKGSSDVLYGGGGADKLWGASGDDTLVGDTPTAASKADTLRGEYGDDTLDSRDGIEGNDTVDGGEHLSGDGCLTDATELSIVKCER